jgi:hypothetical protein
MIDFLKVELPKGIGAAWAKHPALDFITPVNLKTGECAPRSEAQYKQLLFTTYPSGLATMQGSLHKLRHGQHNGGDFPAWAVAATIDELAYSFKFRPAQATLRTLEFGLNVPLPVSATDLLSRAVLYKTLPFDLRHFGGKGYYLEAEAQQYYLKLYNKQQQLAADHYWAPVPLLRVEVKTRRMEWLRDAGITTLADLANPTRLALLGERLAETFDKTLFTAVAIPTHLSKAEQRLLMVGRSPHYWQILQKEHPDSLRKNRQRYRKITAQHVPDVLALAAAKGLKTHWEQLRTAAPSLPHLISLGGQTIPELTDLPAVPDRPFFPGFNSLSIGVEVGAGAAASQPAVRQCQTCGRDITRQAGTSRFCSEAHYGDEGKRCRNAASNPRHNTRRAMKGTAQQSLLAPTLFDIMPYLRLPAAVHDFALAGLTVRYMDMHEQALRLG